MKRLWSPLLLVLLLAGHFFWLSSRVTPGYASPDADGYFAQAELMADHHRVSFRPESDLQFVGVHWLEVEKERFISRYPPGFPAVLAAAWKIGGRDAALWVNPVLCTLTLLLLYLLCRPWTGGGLAFVAALVFAVHPLANYHAIHADAHTSSTFFLVGGLWLLSAWARAPSRWRAVLAGLALGIVPTIRPAEGAAALGIGVFVLWQLLARKRGALFTVAGAMIPVGLFLAHNWYEFGSPFLTGYHLTAEQQSLSLDNIRDNFLVYADTLMGAGGVGLFLPLGLAGLFGMLVQRGTRAFGLCLLLVVTAITVGYSSYYWGGNEGMIARFILPTMPLYLLPAFWLVRLIDAPRVARVAVGALVVLTVARGIPGSIERVGREYENAKRTSVALEWCDANIPAGSIVLGERRLQDYLNFAGKWRLADSGLLVGGGRGRGFGGFGRGRTSRRRGTNGSNGDRVNARPSPMQAGKGETMREKYRKLPSGEREVVAINDMLDWAKDHDVYWIGRQRDIDRFDRSSGGIEVFEKVGEFDLPAPPREPRSSRRRGIAGLLGRFRRGGGFGNMFALSPGKREVFRLEK